MKKGKKILLSVLVTILAVVIISVTALVIWQYENISAFIIALKYEEHQIDQMVGDAHNNIITNMENDNIAPPRQPTKEEETALTSGEITQEQFTSILTGQTTLDKIREENKIAENKQPDEKQPEEQKPTEQKPAEQKPIEQKPTEEKPTEQKPTEEKPKDYETLISEKVAEMYAIKANYYAEFNEYWAKAKAEFLARPEEEHTKENVALVVKNNMDEGLKMEDRYDAMIEQVVSELTELLKASGKDTSLADAIKNAYVAEKKAEKARIMQKYFG